MAENTDDLVKQFKSKVEDAISLLPSIPETQRGEVWTYWQIVSMAVKVAVGWRGPVSARHAQRGAHRGRSRGRRRLAGTRQKESLSTVTGPLNHITSGSVRSKATSGWRGRGDRRRQTADRQHRRTILSPGGQTVASGTGDSSTGNPGIQSSAPALVVPISSAGAEQELSSAAGRLMAKAVVPSIITSSQSIAPVSTTATFTPMTGVEHSAQDLQTSTGEGNTSHTDVKTGSGRLPVVSVPTVKLTPSNIVISSQQTQTSQNVADASKFCLNTKGSETLTDNNNAFQNSTLHENAAKSRNALAFQSPKTGSNAVQLTQSVQQLSPGSVPQSHDVTPPSADQTSAADLAKPALQAFRVPATSVSKVPHESEVTANEKLSVLKVSDLQVSKPTDVVSLSDAMATASPPARTETTAEVLKRKELAAADGLSATTASSAGTVDSTSKSHPPVVSGAGGIVKRKRGRPPKNAVKPSQSQPTTNTTALEKAETKPKMLSKKDSLPSNPEESGQHATDGSVSASRQTRGSSQEGDGFKSIMAALELEEKKDNMTLNNDISPATVRRSVRRSVPNRDNIFCYFSPTHRGKMEGEMEGEKKEEEEVEEEDEDNAVETVEEMVCTVKQESVVTAEARSEEDKMQERTCPICHVVLMSASSMTAHRRIHTGERPFACSVCHKTFTTKGNCERHEVTHVGLKAFSCTQCHKKFTEKKSLKIHMRGHTGDRPYQCQECGMRFFQSGTLKTHMDRHTGHKGHLCELCGKAFRQSCQLRVHMRRHTKNMPFCCRHCNKTFYTKSDMERHELKHTGERPFSCDQCSQTFTRLQYLREHQNIHLGRRPYRCVICNMAFHDFASCHRHVNRHKVSDAQQPTQQIHVEFPPDIPAQEVMEQVRVILNQQQLGDCHTLILPEASSTLTPTTPATIAIATTTTAAATATTTTASGGQSSAQAILSQLGMEMGESPEIYQITLVDPGHVGSAGTDGGDYGVVHSASAADFSAITLLANATTQLSVPP